MGPLLQECRSLAAAQRTLKGGKGCNAWVAGRMGGGGWETKHWDVDGSEGSSGKSCHALLTGLKRVNGHQRGGSRAAGWVRDRSSPRGTAGFSGEEVRLRS